MRPGLHPPYAAMRRAGVEVAAQARSRAAGPFSAEEVIEATDLLEWLLDGHFVLAGCCRMADAPWSRTPWVSCAVLARAHASSPHRMEALDALLADLEPDEVVDRHVEALPTAEEMQGRAQVGAGLTRPELAVLTAGAKHSLAAGLLASSVPEQPALRSALVSSFPDRLTACFGHLLDRHRLRRELIASVRPTTSSTAWDRRS